MILRAARRWFAAPPPLPLAARPLLPPPAPRLLRPVLPVLPAVPWPAVLWPAVLWPAVLWPAVALLALLLLPAVAAAQGAGTDGEKPEVAATVTEPARLDPVVVSVSRLEQRASEVPAAVTVLTRDDIRLSAGQTIDDVLRQVPGFSLFRRSSSMVGHPTTQGLSLRGIGPSGTSRALVLLDEVPINDAFGGWVYWNRMPLQSIEQVEVARGGGSSAWGNYALGGVVNIVSRRPPERQALFEVTYGTQNTLNLDLILTEVQGPWRVSAEGNYFDTSGYRIVKDSRRGPIDIDADSNHKMGNVRVDFAASPDLTLFVTANYYDEDRGNGTPLQVNDTRAGAFAGGARLRTDDGSRWALTLYGQVQEFHSTFSTQSQDRASETLALDQTVPSSSVGGALQWSRRFDSHLILAGGDFRWVDAETDEKVFNNNVFLRTRVAGGQQLVAGVFVQDVWTPIPQIELTGGLRFDYWLSSDGFRRDTPPPAGIPARQSFSNLDRGIVSPRVAGLFHVTPTTDLRASAYQGFRVPTLNELYRVFRVRDDVTVANEHLKPERLTGGEIGVQQRLGPVEARLTGYWNDVQDLIINVTQTVRLADCPVGTTCRQRQNVDLARIRGVEAEVDYRPARAVALPRELSVQRRARAGLAEAAEPGRQAAGPGARARLHPRRAVRASGMVQRLGPAALRRQPVRGRSQHAAARELRGGGPHGVPRLRPLGRGVPRRREPARPHLHGGPDDQRRDLDRLAPHGARRVPLHVLSGPANVCQRRRAARY